MSTCHSSHLWPLWCLLLRCLPLEVVVVAVTNEVRASPVMPYPLHKRQVFLLKLKALKRKPAFEPLDDWWADHTTRLALYLVGFKNIKEFANAKELCLWSGCYEFHFSWLLLNALCSLYLRWSFNLLFDLLRDYCSGGGFRKVLSNQGLFCYSFQSFSPFSIYSG